MGWMKTSAVVRGAYLCIADGLFGSWASYQIRKIAGCACAGNDGNVFLATDFKGSRWLAIPACITARASHTSHTVVPCLAAVPPPWQETATATVGSWLSGPHLPMQMSMTHQGLSQYLPQPPMWHSLGLAERPCRQYPLILPSTVGPRLLGPLLRTQITTTC